MVPADCVIAFASAFLHSFRIDDLDAPPRVLKKPRFLQRTCDNGNAGASYTQRLGQELLSEWKCIAARKVACPEKPADETLVNVMRGIAGRRLLCLRVDDLFVADQQRVQCGALYCRPLLVLRRRRLPHLQRSALLRG